MILKEIKFSDRTTFCFSCAKSISINSANNLDGLYYCNGCFEKRKDLILTYRTSKIDLVFVKEQLKE
ncbi:hypothetical protein LLR47_17400 [Bacillus cereus]|uniref:hypothetical protein n=1 Tax=Bacillus cereus TaxID=1396 RepID=UPI001D14A1F0|nr:hypothetical protein [Bacillus cereus]MCC3687006.1 hypothetical protein [Bacillus cereus]